MNLKFEKIDVLNKVVIITGGNSGIGFETCKELAKLKATVIIACRSIEKGIIAKEKILNECKNAKLDVLKLDLSSQNSIKSFVDEFSSKYDILDILVNNAGVMVTPYALTEDGFETQFGVNHLGHFSLTALLFDKLKKSNSARIINVSSIAHKKAKLELNDINYSNGKKYKPMISYRRSKLANLLFTYELARRVNKANLNILVLAAHPGISSTDLGKKKENQRLYRFINGIGMKLIAQSAYKGAQPTLRAILDKNSNNGDFYGPNGYLEWKGEAVLVKPNNNALNKELMKDLFDYSEKILNIYFNFESNT